MLDLALFCALLVDAGFRERFHVFISRFLESVMGSSHIRLIIVIIAVLLIVTVIVVIRQNCNNSKKGVGTSIRHLSLMLGD